MNRNIIIKLLLFNNQFLLLLISIHNEPELALILILF